mmetsp:Transcript_15616/g.48552  ORF Transcript_15616/g.48552 Transcript_15616/m.48552 type:complete len:211 (-) Transcript_15616:29-661(-)
MSPPGRRAPPPPSATRRLPTGATPRRGARRGSPDGVATRKNEFTIHDAHTTWLAHRSLPPPPYLAARTSSASSFSSPSFLSSRKIKSESRSHLYASQHRYLNGTGDCALRLRTRTRRGMSACTRRMSSSRRTKATCSTDMGSSIMKGFPLAASAPSTASFVSGLVYGGLSIITSTFLRNFLSLTRSKKSRFSCTTSEKPNSRRCSAHLPS